MMIKNIKFGILLTINSDILSNTIESVKLINNFFDKNFFVCIESPKIKQLYFLQNNFIFSKNGLKYFSFFRQIEIIIKIDNLSFLNNKSFLELFQKKLSINNIPELYFLGNSLKILKNHPLKRVV